MNDDKLREILGLLPTIRGAQEVIYEICRHWEPSGALKAYQDSRLEVILDRFNVAEATERFEAAKLPERKRIIRDFTKVCLQAYDCDACVRFASDENSGARVFKLKPIDREAKKFKWGIMISNGLINKVPLTHKYFEGKWTDMIKKNPLLKIKPVFPYAASIALHEVTHIFQRKMLRGDMDITGFENDAKWIGFSLYHEFEGHYMQGHLDYPSFHDCAPSELHARGVEEAFARRILPLFPPAQQTPPLEI